MCDAHNECSGQEWTTNKHAMVRHEDKGSIKRYLESVIRKQHSRYRRDPPMVARYQEEREALEGKQGGHKRAILAAH